jgi:polyhydroxybutyrate depolymerase
VELTRRRRAVALALVLVVMALAAACRGSSKTAEPSPIDAPADITPKATTTRNAVSTPSVTAAAPAPACATAKPHAAGDSNETLRSGGLDRTYILHVPPSYDGTRELPLVLNLHGFGSNARQQAIYSGLPAKGDKEGFIVVSPDGTGEPPRWTYPGTGPVDDIAFFRELLDRLEADLCIDTERVFSAGMSNGAAFSSFIACAMPERIAAIAAVAATTLPRQCDAAPIRIISFRGTDDPCVPYDGGTSKCGQFFPVASAEDAVKSWAEHDKCNPEPAKQPYSARVRTIAYSECAGDAAVILFVVEGGGHTWPGSIDVPRLGVTTHEINATDQIWEFFAAQGALRR